MIKRARKRFIAFTSIILFSVFAVIFGVSCVIMQSANARSLNKMLDDLENGYVKNTAMTIPSNAMIIEITNEDFNHSVPIYEERHDPNAFNNVSVERIINTVIEKEYVNRGNIDDVLYRVSFIYGKTVIFAIDGDFMHQIYHINVVSNLISLSVVLVLLILITVLYSFKLFSPIKETFEKQKRFISDAGHELKTPISIIKANAEVIRQDTPSQWVNNIKEQSDRMNLLVADMLTLTKIQEKKYDLTKERFDLSQLLLENVLPFEAVAFEKGKTILTDVESNLFINSHKRSVAQIVNILLDNACKHSTDNSEIVVSLKKDGNRSVLSVINEGSAVVAGEEEKMFERFYRADSSRSRDLGGSGLGLAIAKQLADSNKWKIFASSDYGKSMCITIIF
ncbi:MAG: HAMP domain-containing histidine kinase [Clostridia bacterium]|nr:HAMP domain-containing histidine kinase [Clostridia bacterium]